MEEKHKKLISKLYENCNGFILYITSVAHPLFAECVHGLEPPPQLVHATISFGPPVSRFFSPWDEWKHRFSWFSTSKKWLTKRLRWMHKTTFRRPPGKNWLHCYPLDWTLAVESKRVWLKMGSSDWYGNISISVRDICQRPHPSITLQPISINLLFCRSFFLIRPPIRLISRMQIKTHGKLMKSN